MKQEKSKNSVKELKITTSVSLKLLDLLKKKLNDKNGRLGVNLITLFFFFLKNAWDTPLKITMREIGEQLWSDWNQYRTMGRLPYAVQALERAGIIEVDRSEEPFTYQVSKEFKQFLETHLKN